MNIKTISSTAEAITNVIDGLYFLIINHAQCAASEQWAPSHASDDSDDYIHNHSEWINKLRKIREDFENLATGFIPRNNLAQTYGAGSIANQLLKITENSKYGKSKTGDPPHGTPAVVITDCDEKNSQCVSTDNAPSKQPENTHLNPIMLDDHEINRCTELITSLPIEKAIEIGFAIVITVAAKNDIAPETLVFLFGMQVQTAVNQGAFK